MTTGIEKTNQDGIPVMLRKLQPKLKEDETQYLSTALLLNQFQQLLDEKPKLAECSNRSLALALQNCIQFGLQPGPLNHVALVPRGEQCIWTIQYQGISELIRRSGVIHEMHSQCYTQDCLDSGRLKMSTFPRSLTHAGLPPQVTRENCVGAYFAITFVNGQAPYFENCYRDEIDRRMKAASTQAVWDAHWIPLAEKSPLRKTFTKNRIPLPPQVMGEVAAAFDRDPSWKAGAIDATAETVPEISTRATRAAGVYAPQTIDTTATEVPADAPAPADIVEPTGAEDPTQPPAPSTTTRRRAPAPATATTTVDPPQTPSTRRPPPQGRRRGPAPKSTADLAGSFDEPPHAAGTAPPVEAPEISSPTPRGSPPPKPGRPGQSIAAANAEGAAKALDKVAKGRRRAAAPRAAPAAAPAAKVTDDEINAAFAAAGLTWDDPTAIWKASDALGMPEDYANWTHRDLKEIIAEAIGANDRSGQED